LEVMTKLVSLWLCVGTSFVLPIANNLRYNRFHSTTIDNEVDVVVIGSGIGGLSCAALLSATGMKVMVLEAHYELGGCAHEYNVDMNGKTIPSDKLKDDDQVFKFEVGPSLYSGLSQKVSANPLKHVFDMIDEKPEWITYDRWGAYIPESPQGYELSIGAENFKEILRRYGGPTALEDWDQLAERALPLARSIQALPSVAVRNDFGIIFTLIARYPKAFLQVIKNAQLITAPFEMTRQESPFYIRDIFLRNYLDLIAFLLQGLPAEKTLTAVVLYMVEDFYRPDAVMEFPVGGSRGIIDALVRGIKKHPGCSVESSTEVKKILVDNGRAVGVETKRGKIIRAKRAVVSNADLKTTFDLVPRHVNVKFDIERDFCLNSIPLLKSFMHVHMALPANAIPHDAPPQWTVVSSWDHGIDARSNVIVVSVPTKLDPSLAPEGYHVIHAYTAGNEPFDLWQNLKPGSPEYKQAKEEAAQPIFDAIAKRAPQAAKQAIVTQIASPLTHQRFLRRHKGNYGLAIAPGNELGLEFPAVSTPLPGYYRCGDSTTAGVGVPAVASSGAQCANAIMSVWDQLRLNLKINNT